MCYVYVLLQLQVWTRPLIHFVACSDSDVWGVMTLKDKQNICLEPNRPSTLTERRKHVLHNTTWHLTSCFRQNFQIVLEKMWSLGVNQKRAQDDAGLWWSEIRSITIRRFLGGSSILKLSENDGTEVKDL